MKNIIYLMKSQLYLKLPVCIVCCFICISAYCQKPEFCGTYKINTSALSNALEYEKSNVNKALSTHYLIRVYLHIIRNDDGSNAGATEAQVQSEFNELMLSYSPANICFIEMGLNYINNSTLNTMHANNASSVALLKTYNIPNCVNIYYHQEIVGAGGTAYNIPNTFCSIKTSNLGTFSTSHEVGHCFGLLHTFEPAYGYEDIDGTNGSTTADLISDTHADPWAYLGQSCFPYLGCVYNGTCKDPKGQTNFNPPYYNTMCYWYVACPDYRDRNALETTGQFNRINSTLATFADLQNCESPDNVTLGPISYSSGYLMRSAVNSLTTSGSVNLTGTTVATLGGQTVFLENGFKATPSGEGLISIEPASCNYTLKNFIANSENSSDRKLLINNNFIAYPNPTSSIVHLIFSTQKNEDHAAVQIFNPEMKLIKKVQLGNLIKGKQNVVVNLNELPSGMYFMVIQLQSVNVTVKVSLIK
ncbi:MAG TPA: T9SS type A sorting domain-containing protein [Parafilimonas sp.]|nr:T9SS type A sorting domain-containing protein [Parafilimonas sp.]